MTLSTKYINQTILYLTQAHAQCYNNSLTHTLTQQHITETSENLESSASSVIP